MMQIMLHPMGAQAPVRLRIIFNAQESIIGAIVGVQIYPFFGRFQRYLEKIKLLSMFGAILLRYLKT